SSSQISARTKTSSTSGSSAARNAFDEIPNCERHWCPLPDRRIRACVWSCSARFLKIQVWRNGCFRFSSHSQKGVVDDELGRFLPHLFCLGFYAQPACAAR